MIENDTFRDPDSQEKWLLASLLCIGAFSRELTAMSSPRLISGGSR